MKNKNLLFWIIAFSISMAFLESAVVIYLRALLYPSGFDFPLVEMNPNLLLTEFCREAATIIMLAAIGRFAGNNFTVSFAWFLISFAIWDIFYYVFLFLFLEWPSVLLEWDILFLIPIPWYGPVIAPVIISLLMLILGSIILYFKEKGEAVKIKMKEVVMMLIGCGMVLYSFTEEFIRFQHIRPEGLDIMESIILKSQVFVPISFHWTYFITGTVIISAGILTYFNRVKNTNAIVF